MRKLLYIFSLSLLVTTCNDGDILDVELDFDKVLTLCGDESSNDGEEFINNFLLYDTKLDPSESLTLLFPVTPANKLIFYPVENDIEKTLGIDNSNYRFIYRTYSGDPDDYICQDIPDANVVVTNDYPAANGATVNFMTTFIDDDNDGIPTALENPDPNGDGDYDDAQDTDGDGLADYIDKDDDNDNVLTANENPDPNDDGDLSDAQNTDLNFTGGDTIPDYLDTDDDGDGIITRYEDEDGNLSLTNDFDEASIIVPNIARYLDPNTTEEFIVDEFIFTTYKRTISVDVKLFLVDITILSTDQVDFGIYTRTITLPIPPED
jgi:hypothetical protein